MNNFVLLSV